MCVIKMWLSFLVLGLASFGSSEEAKDRLDETVCNTSDAPFVFRMTSKKGGIRRPSGWGSQIATTLTSRGWGEVPISTLQDDDGNFHMNGGARSEEDIAKLGLKNLQLTWISTGTFRKRFTDFFLAEEDLAAPRGKFNHVHNNKMVGQKGPLSETLKDAPYVPETFLMWNDKEREKARRFVANNNVHKGALSDSDRVLICKPNANAGGRGIFFVTSKSEFAEYFDANRESAKTICQHFIRDVLTLPTSDEKTRQKFDLRLYVLVDRVQNGKMRAHLHSRGLVRFAPGHYDNAAFEVGDQEKRRRRHLTNTSLHKEDRDSLSHTLSNVLAHVAREHGQPQADMLWHKIHRVVADVFRRAQQHLAKFPCPNCFELFGVDLLVLNDLSVALLEINIEPETKLRAKSHEHVKVKMLHDAFSIVFNERDFALAKQCAEPQVLETILSPNEFVELPLDQIIDATDQDFALKRGNRNFLEPDEPVKHEL
ncbi:MAG: hypothetical protein MHM6MM_006770 [Cercozoa sp. M6MM]